MRLPTKGKIRLALCAITFLALNIAAVAGRWQEGSSSFYFPRTRSFSQNFTSIASIASPRFVAEVGGVAFGGVAHGVGGITVSSLRYDPSAADGNRLVVGFSDGHTVRSSIPDWMLRPIAEFALSDQVAAFSLFGDLEEPKTAAEAAELTRLNDDLTRRIESTLKQLPTAERQRFSEAFRKLVARESGSQTLRRTRVLLRLCEGRALIYHPAFQDTILGWRLLQADSLIIDPVACEVPVVDGVEYHMPTEPQIDVSANRARFDEVAAYAGRLRPRFQSYVVSDRGQKVRFGGRDGRLAFDGGLPYWYCWIPGSSSASVQSLDENSQLISKKVRDKEGVNPEVYDALKHIMRYSALFRAYKRDHRNRFGQFVASLSAINERVLPSGAPVRTPTVTIPNG